MSRMEGRRPNASGQRRTPAKEPDLGWMNAASQVPSGILISTSFSTTSSPAAAADSAPAVSPAATERATKSRRARSLGRWVVLGSGLSVIGVLRVFLILAANGTSRCELLHLLGAASGGHCRLVVRIQ